MRLLPLPRRHRGLWLIVAVLAFSTWGLWLAHSGRAADHGAATWVRGVAASTTAPPFTATSTEEVSAVAADSSEMTVSSPAPALETTASASAPESDMTPSSRGLIPEVAVAPVLSGFADPIGFARAVAAVVLSYDAATDFAARIYAVMAVAAFPPIGSPAELAVDLNRFAPDPVLSYGGATVRFKRDSVQPSRWAAARLDELRLPAGSFAIDVTGSQLVTMRGQRSVALSVTVGLTGACPPALAQCELDRIFPHTVAQELGS